MKNIIVFVALLFISINQTSAQVEKELEEVKKELKEAGSRISELNQNFEKLTNKNIQFGLSIGYRFLTDESTGKYQSPSISVVDSTLMLDQVEDGSFILSTSVIFNPRFPTEKISRNIRNQILAHISENYSLSEDYSVKDKLLLDAIVPNSSIKLDNNSDILKFLEEDRLNPTSTKSEITPVIIYSFISDLKRKIKDEDDEFEIKQLKRLKRRVKWLVFKQFFIDYILDRISINANLNLIEFSAAQKELTFNQAIDGGLGVSYMINQNLYVGVNWESFSTRQLQNYLKERVGQKIIVEGEVITSISDLDIKDDDLYINKSLSGISFKLIASF